MTKVLLWGYGHMNKVIFKYLLERNYQVIGIISHHNIGESPFSSETDNNQSKISSNLKISSENEAEEVIKQSKPDICILSTRSTMSDIYKSLKVLGMNSVNTITICEEAFYSWNTSKEITYEIDDLFKKNNATFTGSGAQDVYWALLPSCIIGSSQSIRRIKGFVQFNVDDYGKALCELHGVGLSKEEFSLKVSSNKSPSYIWNSNEWISACFNWKVLSISQSLVPIVLEKDVFSKSLNSIIKSGDATGMKAVVIVECENGIVIETHMIGAVYYDDMYDLCSWNIEGEPNTELIVNRPCTVEVTCATVINRISQVVQSRSGYVPTYEFGLIPWKK